MVDDEAFAEEPADGDAVLEERVHPRIGMRVVGRRRAVDGVAAGVRSHRHHRHAVGEASVDRLEVLVVERLLPQDGGDRVHQVLIGDRAVRGHARLGVLVVLAAEAHQQVRDRLAEQLVLLRVARLDGLEPLDALLLEPVGLRAEAVGLGVVERTHVRLGHGRNRPEDALLAAPRARAVA